MLYYKETIFFKTVDVWLTHDDWSLTIIAYLYDVLVSGLHVYWVSNSYVLFHHSVRWFVYVHEGNGWLRTCNYRQTIGISTDHYYLNW